ncbi:unnamed protein product [Triticum aestivum]|uniref:Uncharacterized protein n=1 Tax=Triticum aestivum TaxID=4565 RepID=A0A7H4LQI8_WHEAT|nr:unnamed protein product [Triticum aestivum]
MTRLPPVSLTIDSSSRAARRRLPSRHAYTRRGAIQTGGLPRLWPHQPTAAPSTEAELRLSPCAQPPADASSLPSPSPPSPMAVRFPGDAAAANGFGRRSLHEWEAWLLFEANIPTSPDMRAGPTGWRLSNRGVPIPPAPDVEACPAFFAAEVDRVRASLTEEQRALLQYNADNHASWAVYFQHRQEQRLASTNGAPVVGGVKNSEGRPRPHAPGRVGVPRGRQ